MALAFSVQEVNPHVLGVNSPVQEVNPHVRFTFNSVTTEGMALAFSVAIWRVLSWLAAVLSSAGLQLPPRGATLSLRTWSSVIKQNQILVQRNQNQNKIKYS
jgi:hypothetical protein